MFVLYVTQTLSETLCGKEETIVNGILYGTLVDMLQS